MRERDTPADDDELLDQVDMQRHLKVSKSVLHEMIRNGSCPAPFRLGKSRRWRWGKVRDWIRAVELLAEIRAARPVGEPDDDDESVPKRPDPSGSVRKRPKGSEGAGGEPKNG